LLCRKDSGAGIRPESIEAAGLRGS
jgi:hypothetical protein